jgi:hypothetical protein
MLAVSSIMILINGKLRLILPSSRQRTRKPKPPKKQSALLLHVL